MKHTLTYILIGIITITTGFINKTIVMQQERLEQLEAEVDFNYQLIEALYKEKEI